MSAGSKSARSTPLLGLAFLISAITAAWPLAILARSAPSKSRVSTRLSASARMASKDRRFSAAATSSCLTATILLRMSDIGQSVRRVENVVRKLSALSRFHQGFPGAADAKALGQYVNAKVELLALAPEGAPVPFQRNGGQRGPRATPYMAQF